MNATNPILEVRGLQKRFTQGERTIEALGGVDLQIAPGELVAVMGASGSGKSTLLHCIAALTKPDGGEILYRGERDVAGFSEAEATSFRRESVGLVFQAFNLIPTLTVEENVSLPLVVAGQEKLAAERVGPLLERLGLSERRGHRPDALSGGEQQRVAIGRALIAEPGLVLADEPTGNLDSITGQAICELLAGLCKESQRSVLVVTHEPAVAAQADRVLVFKDGKNLAELEKASASELAARYHEVVS